MPKDVDFCVNGFLLKSFEISTLHLKCHKTYISDVLMGQKYFHLDSRSRRRRRKTAESNNKKQENKNSLMFHKFFLHTF